MKLRIAFFGTPQLSVPILESIHQKHTLLAVVSQPDKPTGKGGRVTSSAVSIYAQQHNLPLFTPTSLKDNNFKQQFLALDLDIAVVVAYGKIIPQWILDSSKYGAINIHASLLPKYRGASPISASILNGDTQTGITYILMNSKMDEGDIIFQSHLSISSNETTESLSNKISLSASKDINMVLEKYSSGLLTAKSQDHTNATYTNILNKTDGQVDFKQLPANLERMIRAYYPWPGVWGIFRGKRVKLLPDNRVQMEGKKATALADFKHGYPDFPLDNY